ncbi:integral membrane sensor signal transduction histidine kinase [Paenibacillus algicola]|uniref:histidine kinase n=2 Tax=Paenibacillus TaxID=44249 RepID=A0A4P8XGD2_9BACL|nr:integral membrane sensor signal transduction histidine kinase [Paenibacillus algicola]
MALLIASIMLLFFVVQVLQLDYNYRVSTEKYLYKEINRLSERIDRKSDVSSDILAFESEQNGILAVYGPNMILERSTAMRNFRVKIMLETALSKGASEIAQREAFIVTVPKADNPSSVKAVIAGQPLNNDGYVIGILPLSFSQQIHDMLSGQLIGIGVTALLLATLIAFVLSKTLVKPIKELQISASRIAAGQFGIRLTWKRNDELGDLGRSVEAMAEELQKRERAEKDFYAAVSHELNTPISAISAFNQLMEEDLRGHEELTGYCRQISKNTHRLQHMVDDMLKFSKYNSRLDKVRFRAIHIPTLFNDVVDANRSLAEQRGIRIISEYNHNEIVYSDDEKLHTIMSNLIVNAIKHGRHGSDVWVKVRDTAAGITVEVSNQGSIPTTDLPFVFERFYKSESTGSGSGLGLAICKSLFLLLELPYGVHSEEGWVRFWFVLPNPPLQEYKN